MDTPRLAPLHFDLTTLRLFIATAEAGGVTRAAERLHLAPTAASRRIAELEAQLGLPLFQRRPHGMALTDAGRAMLAHARGIAHTLRRMQDDASAYLGGAQGVVRLAAPKSAVLQFVPADLARCARACPGVTIDLQEMNSQLVHQALARGTVDVGIFDGGLGPIDLPTVPYRDDLLALVVAHGHPLAARAAVSVDDILDHSVIGLGPGSAIGLLLDRLAAERGRSASVRLQVSGFDSIAALVAAGLGIGVMPDAVARVVAAGPAFACRPIDGDWARRRFVLAHRAADQLPLAARGVIEVLADPALAADAPFAHAASAKEP